MTTESAELSHGHSPAAWIAVVIMLLGFTLGAVFFWFEMPVAVLASVALIPVGLLVGWVLAKAGWGVNGPKYQPKGH